MSAWVACQLLSNNSEEDCPCFINTHKTISNNNKQYIENPSRRMMEEVQKNMSKSDNDKYVNKLKSTKNRLEKKLAAKQAKTKDSISLQPSSSFSP